MKYSDFDFPRVAPKHLPDIVKNTNGKAAQVQLATVNNVRAIMDRMGIRARRNVMSGMAELSCETYPGASRDQLELKVLDAAVIARIRARETVRELIGAVADEEEYHPMEEWLAALPPVPDGSDPIGDLIGTVTTENELWPTYLENWLVEVVEAVCGWRTAYDRKLDQVLVLVGGQGVGKSTWFQRLGGEWLKGEAELHLSTPSGKDHQLEVLRRPMAELAELDGIFRKADVSHMKSFLSRAEDSIRAPYERRAAIRPRMTVLCGSVNEQEFLNDSSGSRRFWPVLVESIDLDFQIDFEGVWAEAYRLWQEDAGFRLYSGEDAVRVRLATTEHFMESAITENIREYIRRHRGNSRFKEVPMSALNVLELLYGRQNFNNLQKADATRALRDIYGKHRTLDGKQRAWMVPYNEFAQNWQTWPDKINHLEAAIDDREPQ